MIFGWIPDSEKCKNKKQQQTPAPEDIISTNRKIEWLWTIYLGNDITSMLTFLSVEINWFFFF